MTSLHVVRDDEPVDEEPVSSTRTYGRYRFVPASEFNPVGLSGLTQRQQRAASNGWWAIEAEPAVAMRIKRTFGRVSTNRAGNCYFAHTVETARDLEWFMTRFPLAPMDDTSRRILTEAAVKHRDMEQKVHDVLSGRSQVEDTPRHPTEPPRPYQTVVVEMLRATGNLLLTDDLGLGKTFSGSLPFLHADSLPALVVAPTHLAGKQGRWVDELNTHFPFLTYHVLKTTKPYQLPRHPRTGKQPDVLITTYSKLEGWADALAGKIKYVVFDEYQDLRRGEDTQKGIAAARIADGATYKMGMTATPVYNYAGEVWNLENILAPGSLGTREEFLREWGQLAGNGHIKVNDPAALGSYLREQGLMLGRTRKEVGRELPKTLKVVESVSTDPAVLDGITGDAGRMARLILDRNTATAQRFQLSGDFQRLMRQTTGIAKAPFVAEFCRFLLDSEDKLILFAWHRAVYEIYKQKLAEFNPVMYTGSESPGQKALALAQFTDSDKVPARHHSRILMMSLRSGAGVDGLQKHARVAVFGELDWSPQVHEQGIGRLARDGMGTDPAVAYFLIAEDGSDPTMAQVNQIKRQQGEPVVNPEGKLFDNSTADLDRTRLLAEAFIARQQTRGVEQAVRQGRKS
jgi:hypothetical protein